MTDENSKTRRILRYMQNGHALTQKEAIAMFDCYRLAVVIGCLKDEGYRFRTERIGKSRFGRYYYEGHRSEELNTNNNNGKS